MPLGDDPGMELVALARDAYSTLGVPFGASADEVRRAYRAGLRTAHPDTGAADADAATRLEELRAAYERVKPLRSPVDPRAAEAALAAYAPPPPAPTLDVLA